MSIVAHLTALLHQKSRMYICTQKLSYLLNFRPFPSLLNCLCHSKVILIFFCNRCVRHSGFWRFWRFFSCHFWLQASVWSAEKAPQGRVTWTGAPKPDSTWFTQEMPNHTELLFMIRAFLMCQDIGKIILWLLLKHTSICMYVCIYFTSSTVTK